MRLDPDELRQRLTPLFRENFDSLGELGAAISIWQDGEPLLDLHGGFRDAQRTEPWTADTLVLVWSATKGLGAACVLHLFQEQNIALTQRVAEVWPEFAQAGKSEITFAQLLSHQAGLCALDEEVEVLDYPAVIRALEKQKPLWPPGSAHGYHARTFGFLLDEIVRRITGYSLGQYWRTTFAEPLQLDFWIGLPENENDRVAKIFAAKTAQTVPSPEKFYRDLATAGTLVRKTFTSPRGLHSVSGMNAPKIRAESIVSFGGIGSAHALAKFYAMLANGGEADGQKFFRAETIAQMTTTLSDGIDRVFQIPTAFSAGFMKNSREGERRIFGPSPSAFGHPGAGGRNARSARRFCDARQSLLPIEKSLRLVDALYSALKKS